MGLRLKPTGDYKRSNKITSYAFTPNRASVTAVRRLLDARTAEDRQACGTDLFRALCAQVKTSMPKLVVLDATRPHRVREGRMVYQRYGSYSYRTRTIRVHNRTALRGLIVAAKTFFETVIHELMHHWDLELLGLRRSLHTSGFYHRLGTLKRQLMEAALA